MLSMCNKVEKCLVNIVEMNEGADEDYTVKHTPPHPAPAPLPLTESSIKAKIVSISFITITPTPGTMPDSQEVHNNFWWN